MIEAQHVANFFIEKSLKEDKPISQLKLLKMVYIGYGWVAALLDRRLFTERIEAWKHGPVVPSVYHVFKHLGKNPINRYAIDVNLKNLEESVIPEIPADEAEIREVLTMVWQVYIGFKAWDLVSKTHQKDTPWEAVYKPNELNPIPYDLIKTHFENLIDEILEAIDDNSIKQAG